MLFYSRRCALPGWRLWDGMTTAGIGNSDSCRVQWPPARATRAPCTVCKHAYIVCRCDNTCTTCTRAYQPPAPHHPQTYTHGPLPRFVVKTLDEQGRKVFINVCSSPKVGMPGGWEDGKVREAPLAGEMVGCGQPAGRLAAAHAGSW